MTRARHPGAGLLDIHVVDRRDVEREQLRNQQPADDGEAERTPRLGARAKAERDRHRADQRRHRGHHDWAEADQARLVDRVDRVLAVLALRFDREVDHHDAVLLHEPDEHDDADERVEAQLGPENHQREQRAEPG